MHLTNVQKYSKLIALEYGFNDEQAEILGTAATLHDIGKTMVPSNILYKPAKLTPEEYEIMKSHTIDGAELIKNMEDSANDDIILSMAYDIALHHHERWDGNGYPEHLKGDDISVASQIVGIADVFDALTSKRCYKDAFSKEKAKEMILNGECGIFSPKVQTAFLKFYCHLNMGDYYSYLRK